MIENDEPIIHNDYLMRNIVEIITIENEYEYQLSLLIASQFYDLD